MASQQAQTPTATSRQVPRYVPIGFMSDGRRRELNDFSPDNAMPRAVRMGNVTLVEALCDDGATGNKAELTNQAMLNNRLKEAVKTDDVEGVRKALEEGADANAWNGNRETVITIAITHIVEFGRTQELRDKAIEIATMLKRAGGRLNGTHEAAGEENFYYVFRELR